MKDSKHVAAVKAVVIRTGLESFLLYCILLNPVPYKGVERNLLSTLAHVMLYLT